jgi:hypothetical protein
LSSLALASHAGPAAAAAAAAATATAEAAFYSSSSSLSVTSITATQQQQQQQQQQQPVTDKWMVASAAPTAIGSMVSRVPRKQDIAARQERDVALRRFNRQEAVFQAICDTCSAHFAARHLLEDLFGINSCLDDSSRAYLSTCGLMSCLSGDRFCPHF